MAYGASRTGAVRLLGPAEKKKWLIARAPRHAGGGNGKELYFLAPTQQGKRTVMALRGRSNRAQVQKGHAGTPLCTRKRLL